MTQDFIIEVIRQSFWLTFFIAGPVLFIGLVVGVVMGILQSATQIQETTLSFVPKLLVLSCSMILGGHWAIDKLIQFFTHIVQYMSEMASRGQLWQP